MQVFPLPKNDSGAHLTILVFQPTKKMWENLGLTEAIVLWNFSKYDTFRQMGILGASYVLKGNSEIADKK